jgi:hypothetical protein
MLAPALMSRIYTIPYAAPIAFISDLTTKVLTFASKYFGLGQAIFFGLYGAKEIAWDGIVQNYTIQPLGNQPTWFEETIHKIREFMVKIFLSHGALYLSSAICMLVSELDTLNFLSLGNMKPILDWAGNILFLGACALAIGYESIMLNEAINVLEQGTDDQKDVAKLMITSSTMSIVGNIGYIVAVGALMLGGPIPFTITFAVVACTIGCVKVLFDFYYLAPALTQDNNN